MASTIRDYSATAASNTAVDGADISEGCSPAGINDAIRGVMADLKDVSTGAVSLESPAADSLSLTGALTTTSTIDGRDVAADGTKLDGIEVGATADQTDAEIRAAVEAATDSNVFTDADHTKLDGIATGATAYTDSNVDAHLNQSTAASGEILSWTGSDYDWVASGGGGADLYAANESSPSAQPSATGNNAIAMGEEAVASGNFSMAIGQDSVAAVARAIAIGRSRSGGDNALAVGIMNITSSYGATGDQSFAQCDRGKASGQQSFSSGKQSIASGFNSVAIGRQASASSTNAVAFGYQSNAQGTDNISIGREATTPSWASTSIAIGRNCKTNAKGKIAFGAQAGGIGLGLAQSGMLVLHARTANSTSSVLTSDGSLQGVGTAAYNNQLYLEPYAAMAFDGLIVARGQGNVPNTDCAAFKIEGLIRRESNANTTVLVNSATTVINNAPGWGVTLSADTTNGALAVHVTGSSSANVKWVCTLRTSETIYDSY